jgi:hypothetical protein
MIDSLPAPLRMMALLTPGLCRVDAMYFVFRSA